MRRPILTLLCALCLAAVPAGNATAALTAGTVPAAEAGGTGTGAGALTGSSHSHGRHGSKTHRHGHRRG